jgi:hypothetical protein
MLAKRSVNAIADNIACFLFIVTDIMDMMSVLDISKLYRTQYVTLK